MGLKQRYALMALGSAIAVASAALVIALDRPAGTPRHPAAAASASTPPDGERLRAAQPDEPFAPAAVSRFAYVPETAVALLPTILDLPQGAEPSTSDEPPAWSTETQLGSEWSVMTRREATPTGHDLRFAALPPQRLPFRVPMPEPPTRTYTLAERLGEISPEATKRLAAKFEAAKAAWPPAEITLVAIKDERIIELFARAEGGAWQHIHRYPVLAASGGAGPKLRQGDKQVPEGIYGISFLNPNSRYHVSLRVNYPNAFDVKMAAQDGRKELGGDIMIHGKAASVGCLAVGDTAAEELFVLAAETGLPHVKLIIAPTDFRRNAKLPAAPAQPGWVPNLYTEVAAAMSEYKSPHTSSLLSFFLQ
jgi:hypothetical protein